MRPQIMTAGALFLILLGSVLAAPALAQDPGRGTTLVCAGMGGDGLTLVEWTSAQMSDHESNVGRPVALAHRETGNCQDPAGQTVGIGWIPGTKWLCEMDAEGRSVGPIWVWEMYQGGDQVPPDPETGRCPQPWSYPQVIAMRTETEYAAATAVHMTELEVAGDYDRLYAWMHRDSQALVPQEAMEGWYREEFALRTPTWMTVDDVRLVEWTWDVTGKVYPSAAEVSFRQRFVDGEETDGVVRLVRDQGVWRWFFGRDRAFLEETIAQFGDQQDFTLGASPSP
jgi:hypothetical protein